MRQTIFQLLIIGLLIHSSTCLAGAQQAELLFNRGITAFNAQDYEAALRYFQQAEQLGLSNKRLPYNLGVTLYKLENYDAAYKALKGAVDDSDLAAIAYFNRGLAALKLANTALAKENFQLSYHHAKNPEQRQLAQRMLKKLGVSVNDAFHYTLDASLNGSLGYNDNVTLNATEDLARKSEESDNYVAVYANLNQAFTPSWFSDMALYTLQYADLNNYNYTAINANINYKIPAATSNLIISIEAQSQYFDNNHFQNVQLAQLDVDYAITPTSTVAGRYQFNNIDATEKPYRYLAGNRQRLRFFSKHLLSKSSVQWFYEYEINDRNDITNDNGNEVNTSFSPSRNTLGLKHNLRLSPRINFRWGMQYRRSDFPVAYQVIPDTTLKTSVKRKDNRTQASLRLMYRLSKKLWIYADYGYLNNQSNIEDYDYQSNTISLNLYWD